MSASLCGLNPAAVSQTAPPTITLQTTSQLVVLDVVVEDREGHPVHGLDAASFRVTEDKLPQTVRHFEAHAPTGTPATSRAIPKLAPGFFLDYTPPAADDTLDVILIDSLNTPPDQQMYLRKQLLKYLETAPQGRRVAIFGLRGRLILLQGFTSDPHLLRSAIDRRAVTQTSSLADAPGTSGTRELSTAELLTHPEPASPDLSGPLVETIDHLNQFLNIDELRTKQNETRVQLTLEALHSLARYLDALPGHKNVVWFSSSFPISPYPSTLVSDSFQMPLIDMEQYRETVNLFTRAKVALYPVDATGLQSPLDYDSTSGEVAQRAADDRNSRTGVRNDPTAFDSPDRAYMSNRVDEHALMNDLADNTGGHAFYNSNDLATAAAKAFDFGSKFYSLSYVPSNHNEDGKYRHIRVELIGPSSRRGYRLSYRRGYFADENHRAAESATASDESRRHLIAAYSNAAMAFGAPAPENILFEARILPVQAPLENEVANGNRVTVEGKIKGPFRRFHVDCVALPAQFTLVATASGHRAGGVETLAYVYNADGKLLDVAGETLSFDMNAAEYAASPSKPLHTGFDVSVPDKGQTYLRVAVRDVPTNRYGVIELPVWRLKGLPPLTESSQSTSLTFPVPAITRSVAKQ